MNLSILKKDEFFVDQKVNFLRLANVYKVYGKDGKELGRIVQKLSGWHKILKIFLNNQMLPFHLDIEDTSGRKIVSLHRGWTFWMSNIEILDRQGKPLGYLKQKWKFLKPTFIILDKNKKKLGEITGDWKAWNFEIKDARGNEIGAINKKWSGVAREFFTQADKYRVSIHPRVKEDDAKAAILAAAITIDMVLKETK